jgi:hypothetical protein
VNGGYDLVISPIYKRILAEAFDSTLALVFKVIMIIIVMGYFEVHMMLDIKNITNISISKKEDDQSGLLKYSSEFITLEIVVKLITSLFEAFCYNKFGASVGKMLLGIRVIQCEAIVTEEQPINLL